MKITSLSTFITNNLNKVNENIEKLADPSKSEDIVNKFIKDVFESEINTSLQEINNYNEAIGFAQIADKALNSISKDLNHIKTLQVAANNATLNSDNLAAINSQIQKYAQNINNTLNQTTYNNKNVFGEFNFNGLSLNTSMPKFDINKIDDFEKALNYTRSNIASFQKEVTSKIDNLSTYVVTNSEVKAQNEVDIAKTITEKNNEEIKLNATILAQVHNIQLSQQNLINLLK